MASRISSPGRSLCAVVSLLTAALLNVAARGGDLPDPAATLAELARAPAPDAAKLRDAYVQLQWRRLLGETALPARTRNDEHGIHGKAGAPLTDEEKNALKTWLNAAPKLKEKLLLALEPGADNYPDAARVALALHAKFPKEIAQFENLLVAFAVTWDDTFFLKKLSAWGVPELSEKEPPFCTVEESFEWYTANAARLNPSLRTMPWRLLTYVSSEMSTLSERAWILKKYPVYRNNLGVVYSELVYDNSKLTDPHGKLGTHDYTLENLKQYGGVCRDQAYYARAVCRTYGVPAYFATGTGNSALHHAWVGWISQENGACKLLSHGRYEYDKYFTATVFEPQSGKMILDYLLGIEARALSDEKGYDEAELLFRVWQETGGALTPAQKLALLIGAIKKSAFHREAWLQVADAAAAGNLPRTSAEAQWDYLTRNFREFPDFVFAMLSRFSAMYKTPAERFPIYESTAKYFLELKRQDLVARLRKDEIDMCAAENNNERVQRALIEVINKSLVECTGEGADGAELAKRAVALLTEMKQQQQAVRPLQIALRTMPKQRMKRINPHWKTVMELLAGIYKDIGDAKNAAATLAEVERVVKSSEPDL